MIFNPQEVRVASAKALTALGMFRRACDTIEKWDNNLPLTGVVKLNDFFGSQNPFFKTFFPFKEMCIELLHVINGNESLIYRRLEDTDEDARSQAVISVVIKTYCRLWHTNIPTFLCQIDMMKTCHTQFFYIYGTCRCTVIYQVYLLESLCEIPGACSYKPMIENFVKSNYLHIKSYWECDIFV